MVSSRVHSKWLFFLISGIYCREAFSFSKFPSVKALIDDHECDNNDLLLFQIQETT